MLNNSDESQMIRGNNVLEVNDISSGYNTEGGFVTVLKNLDFVVKRGEIFGIAGESGSGKSTVASTIFNTLKYPGEIVSGSIKFNGIDILNISPGQLRRLRATKFSYVPQAAMNSLNPVKRIGLQFHDIMLAHDIEPEENDQKIKSILDTVKLDHSVLNSYPHELSGGMRQRVTISMALLLNPELVILDEPTTGLDVLVEYSILKDIRRIQREMGLTIIFITHDLSILFEIADRIAIIYGGEIVEIGEYEKLLSDPAHPYTYLLLKSIPLIGIKADSIIKMKGTPINFTETNSGCLFSSRCPYVFSDCKSRHPDLIQIKGEDHKHRCIRYPDWKR